MLFRSISLMNIIREACDQYNAGCQKDERQINISLGVASKETDDADLVQTIKRAEEYMNQRKLLEKDSSYSSILSSIKATMLEKSQETEEHAERIARYSREIGLKLDLTQQELDQAELVATLHDIGKVGIPERILRKPGKLDEDEWKEIKKHPEIGFRIAMSSPTLASVANLILSHHERWDGKGYPRQLSGTDIPLISRIIAIVDSYDAMTQTRAYKKALTRDEAVDEIRKCSGTQFDPQIAQVFIDIISKEAA